MREEKGVCLVVYKVPGRSPRFAVLKRKKNWEGWELPKGHKEGSFEQTAHQELREETGITEEQVIELEEMNENLEWSYEENGEKIRRKYRCFLVKVEDSALIDVSGNPHDEHEKGHFLNLQDAESILTYEDQREVLEEAAENIE